MRIDFLKFQKNCLPKVSLKNSNVNYLISITKDSKLEKKEKVLDLSKYIKDKLQFAMSKWSNKEIFKGEIDTSNTKLTISPPVKKITKLAFLNLGHPFQPFIIGQRLVGAKVALEKKIEV